MAPARTIGRKIPVLNPATEGDFHTAFARLAQGAAGALVVGAVCSSSPAQSNRNAGCPCRAGDLQLARRGRVRRRWELIQGPREQIVMLPDFARSARHRGSWNAWTTTLRGPRSTRDRSRRDAL
jgi:hypothetical protein